MKLLAGVKHLVDQLARQRLEHRHLLHDVNPLRHGPGAVVHELAGGAGFGVQHGDAVADGLLVPQGATKGLAAAHMVQRELDGAGAVAHRHRTQRDALGLEIFHHRIKALALLAQQVLGRDAHVVKNQLGRVGRQPAGFSQGAAHTEAGGAFVDNEHRHVVPSRTGFGRHKVHIGMHTVGDEHLGAVEDPDIALTAGCGAHARHVRARARLADGDGCDQLARRHTGQITRFLCGGARVHQMRAGHVGVHQHGDDEAAKGGLRQRFGKHQVGQRIRVTAAVLGADRQPQQAGAAHALQHVTRHHAGVFPSGGVGLHLTADEAGNLLLQ